MADPVPLPHKLPSLPVELKAMYDAQANAEDIWYRCEGGEICHSWYRAGIGWSFETVAVP